MLAGVNVVASQTCHCRRLEAAAFCQQFDLAPMYINLRAWIRLGQFNVFVQRFSWKIGKGWGKRHTVTSMAPGA